MRESDQISSIRCRLVQVLVAVGRHVGKDIRKDMPRVLELLLGGRAGVELGRLL